MTVFLWGALSMACATAGLFFLRYWRATRDRLFIFFALAFGALALNWVVLAFAHPEPEASHQVYFIRLAAFVLIIAGILDKNRRGTA
jgi:hypothetical protein